MNSLVCHVSALPDDLQVLLADLVEDSLGEAGLQRMELHYFTVKQVPVAHFPRVKMWTDYRDRAYSEAMIGQQVPPVVICGDQWLDGRNRVWAARRSGRNTVDCIDLSEIGVRVRFERLERLRRNATRPRGRGAHHPG